MRLRTPATVPHARSRSLLVTARPVSRQTACSATPQPAVIEVVAEAAAEAPSEAVSGIEIAQADAAEDIAEAPAAAEAGITASADDARSRVEQLRGLFDSARNDAAQDEAATEAGRNA